MTHLDYEIEHIPIGDAGPILPQLPKRLAEEDRAVALTVHGRPVLAVMTWDLFESIVETMEIMGDADMMVALRRGIEDAQEGNLIPIEQVVRPPSKPGSPEHQQSPINATWGLISVDQETFDAVMREPGYLDV